MEYLFHFLKFNKGQSLVEFTLGFLPTLALRSSVANLHKTLPVKGRVLRRPIQI
jgi:hypothetical protein